jgi:hypothetical protein
MEHRDPVLRQELVEQAAAMLHPADVHHRRHGRRQHRVNGKQQRRDKQEGELQRFGNPTSIAVSVAGISSRRP